MEWDWESLAMISSKACESPKKLQLTDWGIVEDDGSFNLSGGGSDLGPGSSAKSTISASTNSSPKDGETKESSFTFDAIGLKLGKRTYFENNCAKNSSISTTKTRKQPSQSATTPHCQVEGCNLDLSSAKGYHRKHRVCESHSKCPKVIVGGIERRFCQQCSRFHSLPDFDEKKRSCRRRLSDHNARRRKPHQDTYQFNSARLSSSSCYDGRQQINFVLKDVPFFHSKTAASLTWDYTYASKFTVTREFPSESEKTGSTNKQPYMSGMNMNGNASDRLLATKATQGIKESVFSSSTGTTQEFPRALSLLSTSSLGSCEQNSTSLDHPTHANQTSFVEPVAHTIPLGLPIPPSECWQTEPHPTNLFSVNVNSGTHLQDVPLFKVPQDTDFYLNAFN